MIRENNFTLLLPSLKPYAVPRQESFTGLEILRNEPPKGNSPRYPLQIVEVDELEPSFRKETVTVIDDRNPDHDSEFLQLSNFSLLEDRETNNIEIYLTRLGENGGGADIWTANAYKYTLSF